MITHIHIQTHYVVLRSSHISSTCISASVNLLYFVDTQTKIRLAKIDMFTSEINELPAAQ